MINGFYIICIADISKKLLPFRQNVSRKTLEGKKAILLFFNCEHFGSEDLLQDKS